jgi:photosystem II stability/assembly factor-like uncharacterized protein
MNFKRNLIFFISLCSFGFMQCTQQKSIENEKPFFTWDNVLIGGGGYVTGIAIHPKQPQAWYIRTDVGAAYRWNEKKNMLTPITDWISIEQANLYGVAGIALDPENPDIIFVAAGRYPFAAPSDVLVSHDRGSSWERTGLNQPFGSNKHPEKIAEKLKINPHNLNELWCGTMGAGLWRYQRNLQQWQQIKSLDTSSNVQTLDFHPDMNKGLFVAVRGKGLYQSVDNGVTFQFIPGSPSDIIDIAVSTNGDYMFVTTQASGIQRLDNALTNNKWNNISPIEDTEFRGVASDPYAPSGLAVVDRKMNGLREGFYYSPDGGNSWKLKQASIEQVIPWHGENYPGSAVSTIEFHPQSPDTVYITDWYSVYRTGNFRSDTVSWSNAVGLGHEELVCLNLAAVPANQSGISLYSAHADVGGFAHKQTNEYPAIIFRNGDNKTLKNSTGLAFCETEPNRVYRIGAIDHAGDNSFFAASTDYGKTWDIKKAYKKDWKWGRVAVSATNPNHLVVATVNGGLRYSHDGGNTFNESAFEGTTGLRGPVFRYGYPLAADKVNGNLFFLYSRDDSSIYVSEDAGKSWKLSTQQLPVPNPRYFIHQLDDDFFSLISIPDNEGHLLLAIANQGLLMSTDKGNTWESNHQIKEAPLVAAGKPITKGEYPALYVLGKKNHDEELWYYYSRDMGKSWAMMNDENHRIGNNPEIMAADRQVAGKVYIGTNGSGIVVGKMRR